MSKISTLVGEVIDGIPVFHHEGQDGERFYKIKVNFAGTEIDVVFSAYTKKDEYKDKIAVTGFLASRTAKYKVPDFFIFANKIVNVDIDTTTTNEICFQGKISRVGQMNTSLKGVDALTVYISDYTPLKSTSVLYICAKDKFARMLQHTPKGTYITGKGNIKPFKDVYEIVLSEIVDN